jgi:hypothetical protein
MKKLLLALLASALFLAAPFQSSAVVLTTRYVFMPASYYQVTITIGNLYDPSGPVEVHDGTVIYGTWNAGCAPPNAAIGSVAIQVWNAGLGAWITQTSSSIYMPAGCESSHFAVWVAGGGTSIGANSESPYCPCH